MIEQINNPEVQEIRPQNNNVLLFIIAGLSLLSLLLSAYTLYRQTLIEKMSLKPQETAVNSEEQQSNSEVATTEPTKSPTSQTTNSAINPENTQLVTTTISPVLEKLSFRINPKVFTVEMKPKSETTGTELATITLRNVQKPSEINLIFQDLTQSPKYSATATVEDMQLLAGVPVNSTLPAITINSKKFTYSAAHFGEGFPDEDNSNCSNGSGAIENYFKVTSEIAVFVEDIYSKKECDGKVISRTSTLTPEIQKEIQKVLETIQIK